MQRESIETGVADFVQAVGLLVRRVRAASASDELSLTEAAVLSRLAKEGPATTADLARAERIKPQSMGTAVASLEQMGLVQRIPHPTDGRQANIELTAKGSAVRKSSVDAKRAWLVKAVAQLEGKERKTLFKATGIIKRLVDKSDAY